MSQEDNDWYFSREAEVLAQSRGISTLADICVRAQRRLLVHCDGVMEENLRGVFSSSVGEPQLGFKTVANNGSAQ